LHLKLKELTQIYCWWYSKSKRFGNFCQVQSFYIENMFQMMRIVGS